MAQGNWSGIHIPIITPFKDDYSIDDDGLRRLVDYCIDEQKADGLVPCGTTGESPTLSHEEHHRVIEIVMQATAGRVPVIAGTGSNSTHDAIEMTKRAEQMGVAASLQVTPYYNKPEQHGLIAHFEAIAHNTSLPIILYNIPGRTGRLIDVKTMLELAKIDNIVGVKDAAANINQSMDLLQKTRTLSKKFYVLSGEDALTYPLLCLGGDGAIAAVAHVIGKELHEMMQAMARGDYKAAQDIHFRTLDVVNALFIESNPVPVKTAMEMMGQPAGKLRLPLVPMRPETRERLRQCLQALGKI
ncbi:MAG: 4-hydroxy-tetrahydrodipicolinate synthase [Candidatus Tectomicrobia bacterium]|uniref:4-hydroxy-tetrahydrodipicolinate synthase n=1 Tax=Tectimicrobiota bacterium TaxID=2528274 RepID=A0A937VZN9_UNCTE|nr:4-hydroxy-tetrahydrodipicolinate synthase [Candidatus Tectomicrobia bacterium]